MTPGEQAMALVMRAIDECRRRTGEAPDMVHVAPDVHAEVLRWVEANAAKLVSELSPFGPDLLIAGVRLREEPIMEAGTALAISDRARLRLPIHPLDLASLMGCERSAALVETREAR